MTRKVSALEEAGRRAQRELLLKTLADHRWSYRETARALGIDGNLSQWLRHLGLVEAYREGRASVGLPTRIGEAAKAAAPEGGWTQVPMFDDEPA